MVRVASIILNKTMIIQQDGLSYQLIVGTHNWFTWLSTASSFVFTSKYGSFTAHKERAGSKRGGLYWKAYRKYHGKIIRAYLGKSENLTLTLLNKTARLMQSRVDEIPPEPSQVSKTKKSETHTRYTNDLTAREFEVLILISKELSYNEVSLKLGISPRTVNTHLTSIYQKLGVTTRQAASEMVNQVKPKPLVSQLLPADLTKRNLLANLTNSEARVLHLVSRGKSNRQIARELGLSEKTVAHHITHILSKTASENRASATAFALSHGLA